MATAFNAIEATARLFRDSRDILKKADLERIAKQIAASNYHNPDQLLNNESVQLERTYEIVYPNTHAYAAISMAYATAEYWLDHLTRALQEEKSLPANSRDFSGDATQRVSKFGRVFGFLSVPEDFLSRFAETGQIRNCIMHAGGRVVDSRDRKNLEQVAGRGMGISIDEDGRLQFTIDAAIRIVDQTGNDIANLFKL